MLSGCISFNYDLSLNPSPMERDFISCKQHGHLVQRAAVFPFSLGERVRDRGRYIKTQLMNTIIN